MQHENIFDATPYVTDIPLKVGSQKWIFCDKTLQKEPTPFKIIKMIFATAKY